MSTFWVSVTNACNLNCSYCFQENKAKDFLSKENADKIIKTIFSSKGDEHTIVFFGGEPLLNFDVIKYMDKKFKSKSNVKFNYSMTSNLVAVSDEMIDFIKNNEVSLSVSLDDTETTHNLNRYSKNGNINSFQETTKNLHKLLKAGVKKITIIKVLTKNTQESFFEDIIFLDKFGCNISVNLDIRTEDIEDVNEYRFSGFSSKNYIEQMKKIFWLTKKKQETIWKYLTTKGNSRSCFLT